MVFLLSSVAVLVIAVIMPATLQSKEVQSLEVITEGSNKFAVDLYQQLKNQSGNLIVSPISAQIVLTLAYNGAAGQTADEMGKVLHLPANKEQVLEGNKALLTGLQADVLKIANKMFVDKHANIKPEFTSVANSYFQSGLEEKDFQNNPQEAREDINSWVENKTNHKIKDLLSEDSVSSDTRVVLVNAIHFKAKWTYPFKKADTRDAPFYISKDEHIDVPMMSINKSFKYCQSEALDAKILEMPYEGNEFSMIIFLPNKVDGLPEVESKLSSINLADELSKLYETSVEVQIPRFKIESEIQLKEHLEKLGMASAFSNSANFSGIADVPLKIDAVIQKAFIEVNEEGTEAAAATAATVRTRRAISHKEEIICDHPFGFMLVHPPTGSVLFASRLLTIPIETSHVASSHEEL